MFIRRIVSLTCLLSFIALFISSIFTYLTPRGPGSSNWSALWLSKHEWFAMHTNLGLLFLIAILFHTYLNIQPIAAYLKDKFGNPRVFNANFNIALVLTLWVIFSSIFNWPPFSAISKTKEGFGNRGRHHQTEEVVVAESPEEMKLLPEKPPMFYSRKSLLRICGKYDDLDVNRIVNKLEEMGIKAGPDWTFKDIAQENDMETRAVYDTVYQVK
jgi:magnesium-transporting ATPase (P-type)